MAIVYEELDTIINSQSFGGVALLSNATVALCLSALVDADIISTAIGGMTEQQIDQFKAWRAEALAEVQTMPVGWIIETLTDVNPFPGKLLKLDGSTHLAIDYPDLYTVLPAVLKTATDFTLPDMSDKVLRGHTLGTVQGDNAVTLSIAQLPPHNHSYNLRPDTLVPAGELVPVDVATTGVALAQTGNTGSGAPVALVPLSLGVIYWVVAE